MKKLVIILALLTLSGCAAGNYTPPTNENSTVVNSRILNEPFDKVWSKLINHLASTYFGIENYEKQSGLITLTFGSSNPSDFITGGKASFRSVAANFEGEYVDYLVSYSETDFIAKMNVVVAPVNETQTKITVNARYVFGARMPSTNEKLNWSFNTNGYDVVKPINSLDKKSNERIMMPTHKAEKDLLDALSQLN